MRLAEESMLRDAHPVDVIEQVAHGNDWSFERTGDDEIAVSVTGNWTDYHVSFSWIEEHEALHLACAFDLNVAEIRRREMTQLLAQINERLLIGHFDFWQQAGAVMFRHSLLLAGGVHPTGQQVEALLVQALEACEMYYQSCQYVAWGGVSAEAALQHALFETKGNA